MTIVYHEEDGDLNYLTGRIVSVIGYGSLGRPVALNLRDSGIQLIVGRRGEEPPGDADGLTFSTIEEAVKNSHIIMMLLPDEAMPEVYLKQVSPNLLRGHTLIFGSAYNVAFGFIEPPPFVDVGLIAPRTLGPAVRERYEQGQGFHSFVAVGQDGSGQAWRTVLALARAMGSLRAGAVEVSFEQEAELDLFIQQAVLPAFHHIMITAAHVLVEAGYPPEAALTDLYLSGEFTYYLEQAASSGLMHALRLAPLTSQYGTLSRLDRFSELKLERLMEVTLEEIRAGRFAHEWAKEYADGYRRLNSLLKSHVDMEMWELEQQTLDMLGRE